MERHCRHYMVCVYLQMFIFNKIEASDIQTQQFEITGSTYAPDGDL